MHLYNAQCNATKLQWQKGQQTKNEPTHIESYYSIGSTDETKQYSVRFLQKPQSIQRKLNLSWTWKGHECNRIGATHTRRVSERERVKWLNDCMCHYCHTDSTPKLIMIKNKLPDKEAHWHGHGFSRFTTICIWFGSVPFGLVWFCLMWSYC